MPRKTISAAVSEAKGSRSSGRASTGLNSMKAAQLASFGGGAADLQEALLGAHEPHP
jgi:hypothetical protein